MSYARTAAQRQHDLANKDRFEAEMREALLPCVDHSGTFDLDFYLPDIDVWVEVKEKRQPLTERWCQRRPDVAEPNLFVLDERTVRVMRRKSDSYLVVNDAVHDRLFVASIDQLICMPKVRVNRDGKGKWLVDLNDFDPVEADWLRDYVAREWAEQVWAQNACIELGHEVDEI